MKMLPAQSSLRLLLPMGSLALIAGVVCGFLAVILMWLAPFDETVSGSSLAAGAERFWAEYGVFAVHAALIGAAAAITRGLGAYAAIYLAESKNIDISGRCQAMWAASGTGAGSLLPALFLFVVYLSDPADNSILYAAAGFVVLCFALTYVLMYLLLSCMQRRDHRIVQDGSAMRIA